MKYFQTYAVINNALKLVKNPYFWLFLLLDFGFGFGLGGLGGLIRCFLLPLFPVSGRRRLRLGGVGGLWRLALACAWAAYGN